jgi:hypothetical protein
MTLEKLVRIRAKPVTLRVVSPKKIRYTDMACRSIIGSAAHLCELDEGEIKHE